MSYIIKNGRIIAKTTSDLKSGTLVQYSGSRCTEALDASREFTLVNSQTGKIGNGAKWDQQWARMSVDEFVMAEEIYPGNFYLMF